MAEFQWFTKNGKVDGHVRTFNMPAIISCAMGKPCNLKDTGYCYAAQAGQFVKAGPVFANTLRMWAALYASDFVETLAAQLNSTKPSTHRIVRWHSSGDLFVGLPDFGRLTQYYGEGEEGVIDAPEPLRSYADAVYEIVRMTPGIKHYTYTKRNDLFGHPLFTSPLPNMVIRYSVDKDTPVSEVAAARNSCLQLAATLVASTSACLNDGFEADLRHQAGKIKYDLYQPFLCPCTLDGHKRQVGARLMLAREYARHYGGSPREFEGATGGFAHGTYEVGTLQEGMEYYVAQHRPHALANKSDGYKAQWSYKLGAGTGKSDWLCAICNPDCSTKIIGDYGSQKPKNPKHIAQRTQCLTTVGDVVFLCHGTTGTKRARGFIGNMTRCWRWLNAPAPHGLGLQVGTPMAYLAGHSAEFAEQFKTAKMDGSPVFGSGDIRSLAHNPIHFPLSEMTAEDLLWEWREWTPPMYALAPIEDLHVMMAAAKGSRRAWAANPRRQRCRVAR